MFANKIRLEYYEGISEDIKKWREQGFKGEIIIVYNGWVVINNCWLSRYPMAFYRMVWEE